MSPIPTPLEQTLAEDGYAILAERLRRDDEKQVVREALQKVFRVQLDPSTMYSVQEDRAFAVLWALFTAVCVSIGNYVSTAMVL